MIVKINGNIYECYVYVFFIKDILILIKDFKMMIKFYILRWCVNNNIIKCWSLFFWIMELFENKK